MADPLLQDSITLVDLKLIGLKKEEGFKGLSIHPFHAQKPLLHNGLINIGIYCKWHVYLDIFFPRPSL